MITAVLGGATCVWDDWNTLLDLVPGCVDYVIAVNEAGRDFNGHFDTWATLHPEKMEGWITERRRAGHLDPSQIVLPNEIHLRMIREIAFPRPSVHWEPGLCQNGSSGLFAVEIAKLYHPFNKVVLCGVPMDPHQGHYFGTGTTWKDAPNYRNAWEQRERRLKLETYVRSMSGWTAQLLGRPDTAWINQKEEVIC